MGFHKGITRVNFGLDLQLQLQSLASTESHLEKLQDQYDHCAQDLASRDEALAALTLSREEEAAW